MDVHGARCHMDQAAMWQTAYAAVYHGFESRKSKKDKDKAKDLNMFLCRCPMAPAKKSRHGALRFKAEHNIWPLQPADQDVEDGHFDKSEEWASEVVKRHRRDGDAGGQQEALQPTALVARGEHAREAKARLCPQIRVTMREALVSALQGRLAASAICQVVPR